MYNLRLFDTGCSLLFLLIVVKLAQVIETNSWSMKNAHSHQAAFALTRRLRLYSVEFKGVFCQRLDLAMLLVLVEFRTHF